MFSLSFLVSIINVLVSLRSKEAAGAAPWDARTLEWSIPSPPPAYNFAEIPVVRARDDFWHRKYVEDEQGRPLPILAGGAHGVEGHGEEGHHAIHMPSPSYFPLIAALGFPLIGFGLIYDAALVAVGAAVLLVGLYGWALEPASE